MLGGAIKLLFQIVAIVRWSCGQNSNMITILTNVMSIGITDRHPIFSIIFTLFHNEYFHSNTSEEPVSISLRNREV